MERYLIHLKNEKHVPINSREILYRARDLISEMNAHIRLARIATAFIEFDVAIETKDVDILVEKLSPIGDLDNIRHVVEEEIEMDQGIKDGIFYFNNERFWECHEILEGVWKNCDGNEKFLVQGLILVAAGLVHYQKDEDPICLSIFNRALEKLENSDGQYHNIDIDKIKKTVSEMINSQNVSSFLI